MTIRLTKSLLALSFVGAMAVSFPSAGSASEANQTSLGAAHATLLQYGWGDGDGGWGDDDTLAPAPAAGRWPWR
jgi:hypothetical protein